jgi:L-ribulose-5-phosphate 4-epimerase
MADPLQEECFEANLLLPSYGLVDLTFGNVSVADPERRMMAIKPSGVGYEKLKPEQMVLLDFDGNLLEGELRPSSDTPTHRRLYLGFPGVRSVVHTHSRHAVSFAQAGMDVPCWGTTHADYFYGEIPVTRAMTDTEIAGDYEWETGNVIVERFREMDPLRMPAVLVRGHGPFVWGTSGRSAVETAVALEVVAQMAFQTRLLNPEQAPLQQSLRDKHFFRKHGPGAYYGQGNAH